MKVLRCWLNRYKKLAIILMSSNRILFNSKSLLFIVLLVIFSQQACGSAHKSQTSQTSPPTQKPYRINNIKYYPIPTSAGYVETGIASWYGPDFHGKPTSNGERYNMYNATAAHKILPMNTVLLVKNLENGKEEVVRINDRGPFVRGRIIDVSYATAKRLEILRKGTSKVTITALAPRKNGTSSGAAQFDFERGEFYVQIGSFTQPNNATKLQKRFTEAGHTAVIQKYSSPKTVYYRVQVYAGTYLKHAKRAEASLLKSGYKGAFVVAR